MSYSGAYPREVVDLGGYVHRLRGRPLGEGGQGIVFRTDNPDIAVKLISDQFGRPLRSPTTRQELRRRLDDLRLLPLPDLHLASPQSILGEPFAGYTMQLLTAMVPIRTLLAPVVGKLSDFYLSTGGLRRRLRLLAKIAELLARLHAVPVVYADVSPNNIFVSEDVAALELWLIDADNLHFLSGNGPTIYTPTFGAPELVQRTSGVNTLTDIHAFAVLAFMLLAQQHPFIGDAVDAGGGWDSDVDMEAEAFAGRLPWIHDREDQTNGTSNGIPRDLVLSPRLWNLFHQTFSNGRTNPAARPSMPQWVEAFHQASDLTLSCPKCRSTFYVTSDRCPWCSAPRPAIVYLQARTWDPSFDDGELDLTMGRRAMGDLSANGEPGKRPAYSDVVWHHVITVGEDTVVPRHVTRVSLFGDAASPSLAIRFGRNSVIVDVTGDDEYHWVSPATSTCDHLAQARECRLPTTSATLGHLHCGKLDASHRLVTMSFHPRGGHAD